jgi:hypothetical protein
MRAERIDLNEESRKKRVMKEGKIIIYAMRKQGK